MHGRRQKRRAGVVQMRDVRDARRLRSGALDVDHAAARRLVVAAATGAAAAGAEVRHARHVGRRRRLATTRRRRRRPTGGARPRPHRTTGTRPRRRGCARAPRSARRIPGSGSRRSAWAEHAMRGPGRVRRIRAAAAQRRGLVGSRRGLDPRGTRTPDGAPRVPPPRPHGARPRRARRGSLVALALVAGYARRAVVDSDQFANRATAALRDDSVRSADRRAGHRRGRAPAAGRPARGAAAIESVGRRRSSAAGAFTSAVPRRRPRRAPRACSTATRTRSR